jgi:hypothetical protein
MSWKTCFDNIWPIGWGFAWSIPSTGHIIRVNNQSDYALSLTMRSHLFLFPLSFFCFFLLSFLSELKIFSLYCVFRLSIFSSAIWKFCLFVVFFGLSSFRIVKSLKHSDIVGGGNDCKTLLFQEERVMEQIQHFFLHPISIYLSICCSTRRSCSALYRTLTR